MTSGRCLVVLGLELTVLLASAFANQKDNEAKALVQRAKSISAIREEGSPPFHLKATVTLTREDGSTMEGTYTETWVSNSQWRRETAMGDFHRTQVVMGRKIWTSDSSTAVPERLATIPATFDPWLAFVNPWKVDKFEHQEVGGRTTRCFRTKPEGLGVSELCFESDTGTLAARIVPIRVSNKTVDGLCIYRDYQVLGERRVPTSYSCFEDNKVWLQAQIVELIPRPQLDDGLFVPPAGSKESVRCLTGVRPPALIHSDDPSIPAKNGIVTLSLTVGIDGVPRDLKVANSLDPASDNAALEAVRQWRFKPATCEGQPVEVNIGVEVDFQRH